MAKKKVYFNEYNILMENAVYFPLVSGHLHAFALKDDLIKNNYEFMPYIFYRDYPDKILEKYDAPSVAVFSISIWNANLSLEVAKRVKQKFPDCLIVFGGPQVPFDAADFFAKYPFIDVTVRSDGERVFAKILEQNLISKDFSRIDSISFKNENGACIKNENEQSWQRDLDVYPSPYIEGLFDSLISSHKINFQAIIETNRGCPFPCSYCFWGQGGLNTKYRYFSLERVQGILDWLGKNKIEYIFCADSNFGMLPRDPQIARMAVATKEKYGFPQKFRVCYGKNAEETIFETAKILSDAGLAKGVTLARQSNDLSTLEINRRKNIPVAVYNALEKRYHDAGMSTYTELILGLPGETYSSFKKGVEEILAGSVNNQCYIYHCQVFPNTLVGDVNFQKEHGMIIKRIALTEIHCAVRDKNFILEDEDLVVGTNTLPTKDWQRATVLSWLAQLLHGMGASFFVSNYLFDKNNISYTDLFEFIADRKIQSNVPIVKGIVDELWKGTEAILAGQPRSTVVPEFGNFYRDYEEACFFAVADDKDAFYADFFEVVKELLLLNGKKFDVCELKEVVEYQKARTPTYKHVSKKEFSFEYNIPEYFEKFFEKKTSIVKTPQTLIVDSKDYNGDREEFARDMMRKRRNNAVLCRARWNVESS